MAHYHTQNVDYTSKRVSSSRRPAFAVRASMKSGSVAVVVPASIVVLADGGAANALTGENVTEAYLKVQSAASRVFHAASETFNAAKDVAEQVVHTVKPAVDFVTPYVQQSADYGTKPCFPLQLSFRNRLRRASRAAATIPNLHWRSLRNGDVAKAIARSPSGLGLSKTWVVSDGFDGTRVWVQSKLWRRIIQLQVC